MKKDTTPKEDPKTPRVDKTEVIHADHLLIKDKETGKILVNKRG